MRLWIGCVLCLLVACDGGKAATGKERGPCYGNNTCDQGLQCLSGLCVRPPGADCAKVGQKLASFRVGNYAPRDLVDKAVAELTAKCTSAQLTQDEGKCILDATSRYDVASCPRPLLDELSGDKAKCQGAADNLATLVGGQMGIPAAGIDKVRAALLGSCVADKWPEDAQKCVAAAARISDLDGCEKMFPEELRDRLEDEMKKVMEDVMGKDSGAAQTPTAPPPTTAPAGPPPDAVPLPPPNLVDAGVTSAIPYPTATGKTQVEVCQGYFDTVAKYVACTGVPQKARDEAAAGLESMKKSFEAQPNPTEKQVEDAKQACELAAQAVERNMKNVSCP